MAEPAIKITDPEDPRIADYVNIRERDLLRERQTFICEGKTVLQVLVKQSRFAIKSLLILENRLDGVAPMLDDLPATTPVYTADRPVMDAIAGFPMHRGVLAAAQAAEHSVDLTRAKRVIVASQLANHDNVGALFRNAAAFGADAVLLDAQCCDPLYRKAIRVSVGGVLKVPFELGGTIGAITQKLSAEGFTLAALATNGSQELSQWAPPEKIALIVGSEGQGLPSAILETVQTLRISMHGGFDSLNVATTAAIALHHIAAKATPEAR
ncbi:MAG: RNA methyltransferase [Pseudomonadota bacterium]